MNILEKIINIILNEKKEGKESRMVALFPNKNSLNMILNFREDLKNKYNFSDVKELEPEEIHATIRWWKVEDGGDSEKIAKALNNVSLYGSIAKILSVGYLGESLSLMLKSQTMDNIFSIVDGIVQKYGAPPSDYPVYKPHVALFYGERFYDNIRGYRELGPGEHGLECLDFE